MKRTLLLATIAAATFLVGCQTTLPPGAEPGPDGTMAYNVLLEASEPGARIEANGEVLGEAPVTLKIFGDPDGTFHDFGSDYYVIRALPVTTNQYAQIRVFGTGRWFGPEDRIPDRVYFNMNQPPPAAPPVYMYPGYPGYYYGPPVYWNFYWGAPYYHGYHYYHHGYHGGHGLHYHRSGSGGLRTR